MKLPVLAGLALAISLVTLAAAAAPPPREALNVVHFGADPHRVGDDTDALQRAFDAAGQQGRDVHFPPGYYELSRTVIFRGSGRSISGSGREETVLAGDTSRIDLLELQGSRDATVRDLRFTGSHLNTGDRANTGKAVVLTGTRGTRFQRLHSSGAGYLAFDGGATGTLLEDSICEDYGRIGYLIGTGGTVRRCLFRNRDGWKFTSEMQGVYASAGKSNITIEDNTFINVGIYAIQLWGSQNGVYTQNITIQRNTFERCPRVLVCAAGSSGPLYRSVRFVGNTIRGTTDGKSLQIGKFNGSLTDGTELLIEGNVFEDPGATWGIYLTPWSGAPLSGIRIRNNEFRAPNRSSYHGYVCIDGANNVVVENNRFADIGRNGDGESVSAGVYLKSGSDLRVAGNRFEFWPGAGQAHTVDGVRFDAAVRNADVDNNILQGTGLPNCFAVRVSGAGTAANGSIQGNRVVKARVETNGIPVGDTRGED